MTNSYSNVDDKPPPERGRSTRSVGRGSSFDAAIDPHPNPPPCRGRESTEQMAKAISLIQNPGVLGAAALARIDDERALLQRHARQPARHDGRALAAGEHERAQVDMARREASLGAGRTGR